MKIMAPKNRICLIVLILLFKLNGFAQKSVLDGYIDTALKSNLVIQQKNISYEKASYALKIANSLFLPTIAGQGNYITAQGGRNIDIPLGTLLNNVYSTLNQLTAARNFPQVANESVNFYPKDFYDVKVHTTIPIINSDIVYTKRIADQQLQLQEYEIEAYKRELVKNIKSAYYNYQNSLQLISIYQSSLALAVEGKRSSEKLLENGKGLPAYVSRSESEVAEIEAQITRCRKQAENAALYFNFLLNRDGNIPINVSNDEEISLKQVIELISQEAGIEGREELKSLNKIVEITKNKEKMTKAFAVPKVNGFADLGLQAENMKFNSQAKYYMVGLQLNIPLFEGRRNTYKVKQAALDVESSKLAMQDTFRQLSLSATVSKNNLLVEWKSYQSSLTQVAAASSYFRLIDRGYKVGTNSYIETVDARNQLMTAKLSSQVSLFNVLIAAADLERQTASYHLTK